MRQATHRFISILIITSLLISGCVKTRETKIARYRPGSESITQTVGRSGVYKVKWKVKDEFKSAHVTTRYLPEGMPVGFETAPDGAILAVAGEQRVVVGTAPRHARYCCWYNASREETQFAKEVREALQATGEALQIVAVGGLVGAGVVAAVALEVYDSDDCEKERYHHRRHRR